MYRITSWQSSENISPRYSFLENIKKSLFRFRFIHRKQSQAFFKGLLEVILKFSSNTVDSHIAKVILVWRQGKKKCVHCN